MPEQKTQVTMPNGVKVEGFAVQVDESTERWSEFKLDDGTIVRVKSTIVQAIRVPGQFDARGLPMYWINVQSMMSVVSAPDELQKKAQG